MDDLATLIRGIGKIAAALRERADTVKWANASHLHAIADSLDHEINNADPRRRQWRDAPPASDFVKVGTCRGTPVYATNLLAPIREVFRQCGMYDAAANDRLCGDLYEAVRKQLHPLEREIAERTVEVPVVNMGGDSV